MTIDEVMELVRAECVAAGIGGTYALTMQKRKKPAHVAGDPDTHLDICPATTTGRSRPFAFGYRLFVHQVDLVLVAPHYASLSMNEANGDIVQALMEHFGQKRAWCPSNVRNVRCDAKIFLDRSWLDKEFDYHACTLSLEEVVAL